MKMKKLFVCSVLLLTSCIQTVPKTETGQCDSGYDLQMEQMCLEMKTMLCTKVSTCSSYTYEQCMKEVENSCDRGDPLKIQKCKTDFANVKCGDPVPASCLELE
jgi:hypothetical protein